MKRAKKSQCKGLAKRYRIRWPNFHSWQLASSWPLLQPPQGEGIQFLDFKVINNKILTCQVNYDFRLEKLRWGLSKWTPDHLWKMFWWSHHPCFLFWLRFHLFLFICWVNCCGNLICLSALVDNVFQSQLLLRNKLVLRLFALTSWNNTVVLDAIGKTRSF